MEGSGSTSRGRAAFKEYLTELGRRNWQVLANAAIDLVKDQEYKGVSVMSQEEETAEMLRRACLGDIEAKLQLAKEHLDLVVELAAGYASQTGRPFLLMVRAGTMAVVKAADSFHCSQQVVFDDHVRIHVTRAMEDVSYA